MTTENIAELVSSSANSSVLVLGAGLTGCSVAKNLQSLVGRVILLDDREVGSSLKAELSKQDIEVVDELESKGLSVPSDVSFAVVSPGISPKNSTVEAIAYRGIPVLSDVDLAVALVGMPDVVVTGTNGKTTVTSIITKMLGAAGFNASSVGNIGTPISELLNLDDAEKAKLSMVAELSSYQLEWSKCLQAHVGICLNITEDHLERHGSMEDYAAAKRRLFDFQNKNDWALVNADDEFCEFMLANCNARVLKFSNKPLSGEFYAVCDSEAAEVKINLGEGESSFSLSSSKLIGEHNMLNLCVSAAAAKILGASDAAIQDTIDNFTTLEHRLEYICGREGISWINDSKATNADSVAVAVDAVERGQRLTVLLGGKAKQGGWEGLAEKISGKVDRIITFGQDGEMIAGVMSKRFEVLKLTSVKDAVEECSSSAIPGDVILFSPGCASFDAYKNFEERGRHFKELVCKHVGS